MQIKNISVGRLDNCKTEYRDERICFTNVWHNLIEGGGGKALM